MSFFCGPEEDSNNSSDEPAFNFFGPPSSPNDQEYSERNDIFDSIFSQANRENNSPPHDHSSFFRPNDSENTSVKSTLEKSKVSIGPKEQNALQTDKSQKGKSVASVSRRENGNRPNDMQERASSLYQATSYDDCEDSPSNSKRPKLSSHREQSAQLSSHREQSPQMSGHREQSPQLSSHREQSAQLSSHREQSAQLSSHREQSAQLPSHREQSPQLSSHREQSAQLSSHREQSPQLSGHREQSPRLTKSTSRPTLFNHPIQAQNELSPPSSCFKLPAPVPDRPRELPTPVPDRPRELPVPEPDRPREYLAMSASSSTSSISQACMDTLLSTNAQLPINSKTVNPHQQSQLQMRPRPTLTTQPSTITQLPMNFPENSHLPMRSRPTTNPQPSIDTQPPMHGSVESSTGQLAHSECTGNSELLTGALMSPQYQPLNEQLANLPAAKESGNFVYQVAAGVEALFKCSQVEKTRELSALKDEQVSVSDKVSAMQQLFDTQIISINDHYQAIVNAKLAKLSATLDEITNNQEELAKYRQLLCAFSVNANK